MFFSQLKTNQFDHDDIEGFEYVHETVKNSPSDKQERESPFLSRFNDINPIKKIVLQDSAFLTLQTNRVSVTHTSHWFKRIPSRQVSLKFSQ